MNLVFPTHSESSYPVRDYSRLFRDLGLSLPVERAYNEPKREKKPETTGRPLKDSTLGPDSEEMWIIAGEAQDADGNFIERENDPDDPKLKAAKFGGVFKARQRALEYQMEKEANQE